VLNGVVVVNRRSELCAVFADVGRGGIEQGFDTGNLRRRVVQGEAVEATAGIDVLATVRAPGG
jgi:hypothetical protein